MPIRVHFVRGAGDLGRRRLGAWALIGVLAALPVLVAVPVGPARADLMSVPGTMSTAAQNTSSFALHVPPGVEVRAITGVLTMPEVVTGGVVSFSVNGAVRKQVPSALYQKVRIPVDPADVIADGTIALNIATASPLAPGASCYTVGGVASMRKIALDYRGAEVAPTSLADFFPASSSGITVVIPSDADDDMITAGLTAVAALASRYDDDTPVDLALSAPDAATATASQRVVALVAGRAGEVTTAVSTTSGIPMLTFTGAGDDLVNAARTLSTDTLGLSGSDAENPSLETKPRSTAKTRTLDDLGVEELTLSGYGSVTEELELRQDSFGVPVSSMRLHLEGSHTAFSDASGARLDLRANGSLIGSTVLGDEATFTVEGRVPAGSLRSVNDIDLSLTAVAPDGSACTPPSIPPAEVDLDTSESTVVVEHGTGEAKGFQLFPQIYEGTLPVALRAAEGRRASAAINAAALVAELQRAAGSPLEVQLMEPDAFLADDRSGLIVGALAADSEALDAPLKLSETRLLDRDDSTQEVTSQEPYAALESIDRNNRLVLMLGSWAPGNKAAPGELARKVVDAVVNTGWDALDGDLVIADAARPAFVAASRSLAPHQQAEEEKSYAKWFAVVIGILLLLLALQVVIAIRRDRQLSRERDEYDEGPAYVEDEDEYGDYEVDALGDVDDLEVHDYAGETRTESEGEYDQDDEYEVDYEDDYEDEFEDEDDQLELDLGAVAVDRAPDADDWDDDWPEESDEIDPQRAEATPQPQPETVDEFDDDEDEDEDEDSMIEDDDSAIEDESLDPGEGATTAAALPPWRRRLFDEDDEDDEDEAFEDYEAEHEEQDPAAPPPRRRWSDREKEPEPDAAAEPAEPLEPPSNPPVKKSGRTAKRRNKRR